MRRVRSWLLLAVGLVAPAGSATAQTTNGTISGHVLDAQGLGLPGVTVTARSPNLQGVRTVTTSQNGDYVLTLLPSGAYTVSFDLSGFERVQRTVSLAPTQMLLLDAAMGPAAVTETVNVVGRAADVLTQTTQVATNFKQDLIQTLPTNRDISSTLLIAPSVHPSGPGGAYSISGATSFESLFLIDGVNVNENIRGQPLSPYIEDAIQVTTIATDGISAEFGHFSGGVVNMITKSGGNMFSGSLRDTYNDDNWRAYVTGNDAHPFTTTNTAAGTPIDCPTCGPNGTPSKIARAVPQYEYTLGGPAVKDHLWFFTAGRFQDQQASRSTIAPVNFPYVADTDRKRFEIKLTESITSNHRFEGTFTKEALSEKNNSTAAAMDQASLYNDSRPTTLFTVNYNGILSSTFVVESRFSVRDLSYVNVGSPYTDLIKGTILIDNQRGGTYWSPQFCGACGPETRNSDDEFVKGTYFKSTKAGSHTVVFGYDSFDDKRKANNHTSGSGYGVIGTTSIVSNGTIDPQWLPGSTLLVYSPIAESSLGTNFRTYSLFFNDSWRAGSSVTLDLGVRWDKNHGVDSAGNLVARDSITSPRIGVVWDPKRDGKWTVTASVARYTAGLANTIADKSSPAGNPATLLWAYTGAAINSNASAANLTGPATAIQQVFSWCAPDSRGYCTAAAPVLATFPGVSIKIPGGLTSPNVDAYALGISRQLTNRAVVRADYSYRDYRDFYSQRIDTTTGKVTDQLGDRADLAVVENTNALQRRYQGLTISTTGRVSSRTDVGGNYTLSRLWGNFDGENVGSGPVSTDLFQYPEYRQQSWYAPTGDLSADERHRASMWINYGVHGVSGLTLSVLETLGSGLPYGAAGLIDARPYVTNPGYVTPQGSSSEIYYFTNRDAFRTQGFSRADFSASYNHSVAGRGARKADVFVQAQVLNVLNQQDLCGCGSTVFANGGNLQLNTISGATPGTGVLTAATSRAFGAFNPFTTKPVQGVNWSLAPSFGTPLNRFAYDSPRELRVTFGVRF